MATVLISSSQIVAAGALLTTPSSRAAATGEPEAEASPSPCSRYSLAAQHLEPNSLLFLVVMVTVIFLVLWRSGADGEKTAACACVG